MAKKIKTKVGAMSRSAFAPKKEKREIFLFEVIESKSLKSLQRLFDKQFKS